MTDGMTRSRLQEYPTKGFYKAKKNYLNMYPDQNIWPRCNGKGTTKFVDPLYFDFWSPLENGSKFVPYIIFLHYKKQCPTKWL